MITLEKETQIRPYEECPSFMKCSAPVCPLDPECKSRYKLSGEEKCTAYKNSRMEIAIKYPQLLPFKGLTEKERAGMKSWAARSPQEKEMFIKTGTKHLKIAKKGHK